MYSKYEEEKVLVRIQLAMPGNSLDPLLSTDTITREIFDNVYEKLFQYNGFTIYPALSEDYFVEDQKNYRICLRKDVLFHDGSM